MKNLTGYILSPILFIINMSLWALATGGIDVWNYPSSEGKNMFMVWIGLSLIMPIIIQAVINAQDN